MRHHGSDRLTLGELDFRHCQRDFLSGPHNTTTEDTLMRLLHAPMVAAAQQPSWPVFSETVETCGRRFAATPAECGDVETNP